MNRRFGVSTYSNLYRRRCPPGPSATTSNSSNPSTQPPKPIKNTFSYFRSKGKCNGKVIIKAKELKLTPIGVNFVETLSIKKKGTVRIFWKFIPHRKAYSPPLQLNQNCININHIGVYKVNICDDFLKRLSTQCLKFEIYLINYKQRILMGKATVRLHKLLLTPNQIIPSEIEIHAPSELRSSSAKKVYGKLYFSYRLQCENERICSRIIDTYNRLDVATFIVDLLQNIRPISDNDSEEDSTFDEVVEPMKLVTAIKQGIIPEDEFERVCSSGKKSTVDKNLTDTESTSMCSSSSEEHSTDTVSSTSRVQETIPSTEKPNDLPLTTEKDDSLVIVEKLLHKFRVLKAKMCLAKHPQEKDLSYRSTFF